MTASDDWLGRLARRRHPRLAVLVLSGGAVGLTGAGLALAGVGLETLGLRLGVIGGLAFLFGASGYVAFAVFEHGFE